MTSTITDRFNISPEEGVKSPVRVATTVNITLSGLQTIDGVLLVANDRVLVKDQTDATENGIYVVKATDWRRAADFNDASDAVSGVFVVSSEGAANTNKTWLAIFTGSYIPGTTSITFSLFVSTSFGFDSVQDLRDSALPPARFSVTAGYTTPGDGGGAFYYLDAADTATADDGFLCIVASDGGRWKLKHNGEVNVKWAGAVGDSVTDDAAAINAALSSVISSVYFPSGGYRITGSIDIDGDLTVIGANSASSGAVILPDSGVLEAVRIGVNQLFKGKVSDLRVSRAAYSGATENKGFVFYNTVESTFERLTAFQSKYNYYLKPQAAQRVAYVVFISCMAQGGFYNMGGGLTDTGFVNEITFLGCRYITSINTDTQVRITWAGNHLRWIGCSLEGAANTSLYINNDEAAGGNAHSNLVQGCRFEGTWTTAPIVLGAKTQNNRLEQFDIYTSVDDSGIANIFTTVKEGALYQHSTTDIPGYVIKRHGAQTGDAPVVDLEDTYSNSGNSNGIRYKAGRSTGYLLKFLQGATEILSLTLSGATGIMDYLGRMTIRRDASTRTEPVHTVSDTYANSGDSNLSQMRTGRPSGKALEVIHNGTEASYGGIDIANGSVLLRTAKSDFVTSPLRLGAYYLWVDTTGDLRIKSTAPTSDTDGTVVGTQT